MTHTLHLGDCRTVLATLDDNSIDAIVCDPPYELGFMGKAWDNSGIAYDVTVWQQCLRVLKPGGHLIAFGFSTPPKRRRLSGRRGCTMRSGKWRGR